MKKSKNIGIATLPISAAGVAPLSNFVDILYSFSKNLYVITGNEGVALLKGHKKIYIYLINHKSGINIFNRIIQYIYTQSLISFKLAKISRDVDIWMFFGGGGLLLG